MKQIQTQNQRLTTHSGTLHPDLTEEQKILLMAKDSILISDLTNLEFFNQIFKKLIIFTCVKFESVEVAMGNSLDFFQTVKSIFPYSKKDQIILAYELASKLKLRCEEGKLIKLYREINYAQYVSVMDGYDRYFKEKLGDKIKNQQLYLENVEIDRVFNPNFNEDQIEFARKYLKENGELPAGIHTIFYDYLVNEGRINLNADEKWAIYNKARAIVIAKSKREISKLPEHEVGRRADFRKLIKTLEETPEAENIKVILKAKELAYINFLLNS